MEQMISCEFLRKQIKELNEIISASRLFQDKRYPVYNTHAFTPFAFTTIQAITHHLSLTPLGYINTPESVYGLVRDAERILNFFENKEE